MSKRLLGDGTQVDMLDGIIPELLKGLSGSQISNSINQIAPKIRPIEEQRNSLTYAAQNKVVGEIKSSIPKGPISATSKVNNSGFGKFMGKNDAIIGAANGLVKTVGDAFHSNRTGLQKPDEGALKIRDAQYSVLKKIPVTAPFAKAAELLDNTLGAITGGLGSATKADKTLTAIPLVGNTAAIFAGKTDQFKGDIQDINTGDFGGVVSDATRANDLSNVKSVQAKKLNNQIRAAQNDFNTTSNIIDYNKKRLNNNIGQDLTSAMLSKYHGNQQIMLSKKGGTLPGSSETKRLLEEARKIKNNINAGVLSRISKDPISNAVSDTMKIADMAHDGLNKKELHQILLDLTASASGDIDYKAKSLIENNKYYFIDLFNKSGYGDYVECIENGNYYAVIEIVNKIFPKQFKSGGKLEKENIIPTGALHKNLHHIEEKNPDLNITPKGIPVGTFEDGGEFSQTAEIECGEIIFSLDVTKQLEEYRDSYKESNDDSIAVECGKFLVDQIFNNTRDDDKVIKKTE